MINLLLDYKKKAFVLQLRYDERYGQGEIKIIPFTYFGPCLYAPGMSAKC